MDSIQLKVVGNWGTIYLIEIFEDGSAIKVKFAGNEKSHIETRRYTYSITSEYFTALHDRLKQSQLYRIGNESFNSMVDNQIRLIKGQSISLRDFGTTTITYKNELGVMVSQSLYASSVLLHDIPSYTALIDYRYIVDRIVGSSPD
jgi:hypothetical protein